MYGIYGYTVYIRSYTAYIRCMEIPYTVWASPKYGIHRMEWYTHYWNACMGYTEWNACPHTQYMVYTKWNGIQCGYKYTQNGMLVHTHRPTQASFAHTLLA